MSNHDNTQSTTKHNSSTPEYKKVVSMITTAYIFLWDKKRQKKKTNYRDNT